MKNIIFGFVLTFILNLFSQTPEWIWANHVSGPGYEFCNDIVTDTLGNAYIIGCFEDSISFGMQQLSSLGETDILVAKFSSSGALIWVKQIGNTGRDKGYGIDIDRLGNLYITGSFEGNVSFGEASFSSYGYWDIFIAKLDNNGTFLWAKQAGGGDYCDTGTDIAIDNLGNVYVTGYFHGSASFGSITISGNECQNTFIAKLDNMGNCLWAVAAISTGYVCARGIDVDNYGNICVTGDFEYNADFGFNTYSASNSYDAFISKLDSSGNWIWTKQIECDDIAFSSNVSFDHTGNIIVTGFFGGRADFNGHTLFSSGYYDVYIAKLDSSGNSVWFKKAGGIGYDIGNDINTDSMGNIYISGSIWGSAVFDSTTITCRGYDIFIAKLDSLGNWNWIVHSSGIGDENSALQAVDSAGNVFVVGSFVGVAEIGAFSFLCFEDTDITQDNDFFLAKLEQNTTVCYPQNEPINKTMLLNPYPNPCSAFNKLSLPYYIKNNTIVQFFCYDIKGRLICESKKEYRRKGQNTFSWILQDNNKQKIAPGVYFIRLVTENYVETSKVIVLD